MLSAKGLCSERPIGRLPVLVVGPIVPKAFRPGLVDGAINLAEDGFDLLEGSFPGAHSVSLHA